MIQLLYRLLIELTNRKWSSHVLRSFATSKMSKILISSFSRVYQINLKEMEKPLDEYVSLHDFFTRKLKDGMRPINLDPLTVVSPVDGIIEEVGVISKEHTITVKGKQYSISEMVGNDEVLKNLSQGVYMILYLSPSHYHRIHSPISGNIVNQWTIGEKSYPVNQWGLKYGKSPLSKNYRVITEIDHPAGKVLLVKVGAMFVNSIELVHVGEHLNKGEEVAFFSFGSTVILLFEKNLFYPTCQITPQNIRVGEAIGRIAHKKRKPYKKA